MKQPPLSLSVGFGAACLLLIFIFAYWGTHIQKQNQQPLRLVPEDNTHKILNFPIEEEREDVEVQEQNLFQPPFLEQDRPHPQENLHFEISPEMKDSCFTPLTSEELELEKKKFNEFVREQMEKEFKKLKTFFKRKKQTGREAQNFSAFF